MRTALVTGASSGIGREIAKRLLGLGFKVIGVSRSADNSLLLNENFTHLKTDLTSSKESIATCRVLEKTSLHVVVHSAGFGRFEPHEELSYETILNMTHLNLTAPMLITKATLKSLKTNSGYLININSIEAIKSSKFAGVYSATKSGLKAFGDSLFEECRKSSLTITNINPDMTESNFYNELRFETSSKENEKLLVSDIADALEHILSMRKGAVVSDYTIRSLNFGIAKKRSL